MKKTFPLAHSQSQSHPTGSQSGRGKGRHVGTCLSCGEHYSQVLCTFPSTRWGQDSCHSHSGKEPESGGLNNVSRATQGQNGHPRSRFNSRDQALCCKTTSPEEKDLLKSPSARPATIWKWKSIPIDEAVAHRHAPALW